MTLTDPEGRWRSGAQTHRPRVQPSRRPKFTRYDAKSNRARVSSDDGDARGSVRVGSGDICLWFVGRGSQCGSRAWKRDRRCRSVTIGSSGRSDIPGLSRGLCAQQRGGQSFARKGVVVDDRLPSLARLVQVLLGYLADKGWIRPPKPVECSGSRRSNTILNRKSSPLIPVAC